MASDSFWTVWRRTLHVLDVFEEKRPARGESPDIKRFRPFCGPFSDALRGVLEEKSMKYSHTAISVCALVVGASLALTAVSANELLEGVEHMTGTFDDGQEWQLSVPADWNGVLINDLDSVGNVENGSDRATFFLENGYAYTGTRRHPDRGYNWDPQAESDNMVRVLDIFEENFDTPAHAIQFGCSGGGSVGLSVAEDHPGRFDGVISMHASTPVELANMRLDLSVALKAFLDPDGDLPLIIEDGQQAEAEEAWLAALEQAQATPEGRARMALAAAVAQYPMWGSQNQPQAEKPDWDDPQSVQDTMVRAAVDGLRRAVTGRPMWDQPAGLMSWTTDVDYQQFYENANPMQREMVSQMYEAAGLGGEDAILADIEQINAFPRIAATEAGVEYFRSRTHSGNIGIPVLHISNIGDGGTPAAVMAGYEAKIEQQGTEDLYRQAFIDAAGHCTFNLAELAASVDTLVERLETGEWNTSPEAMNAAGEASGLGEARFLALDDNTGFRLPDPFNRAFFRDDEVPGLVAE
tara:strand:+ start:839 stop:2407 length:1569 start_codon:yes stop_codon:yes gene_type:complete